MCVSFFFFVRGLVSFFRNGNQGFAEVVAKKGFFGLGHSGWFGDARRCVIHATP